MQCFRERDVAQTNLEDYSTVQTDEIGRHRLFSPALATRLSDGFDANSPRCDNNSSTGMPKAKKAFGRHRSGSFVYLLRWAGDPGDPCSPERVSAARCTVFLFYFILNTILFAHPPVVVLQCYNSTRRLIYNFRFGVLIFETIRLKRWV